MSQPALTQTQALALLNDVRVASPCDVAWAGMAGTDRIRHCGQCRQHVYDLSSLTALEAVAMIQEHQGNLCVRFWRRADGTILTADCPVGALRQVRRRRQRMAATLAAAFTVAVLSAAPKPPKPRKPPVVVQGEIQCPPVRVMGKMAPPKVR